MKIKRFVDTNMRKVLRQVREAQGPDAVILSNRRVDDGVEVIASVDYDEALIQQALKGPGDESASRAGAAQRPGNRKRTVRPDDAEETRVVATKLKRTPVSTDTARRKPGEATPRAPKSDDRLLSLDSIRTEISSMRTMLEGQLSSLNWERQVSKHPWRAEVLKNLTRIGLAYR